MSMGNYQLIKNKKSSKRRADASFIIYTLHSGGKSGGLMVGVLDSGTSGPGLNPSRGHCVVFLGKTLYSHSASLHPGV